MINVVVTGACGRMGSAIIRHLSDQPDMKLSGAVENPQHKNINKDIGEILGIGRSGIDISPSLEKVIDRADVVIEFVNPKTSIGHLKIADSFKKPIVIGTTGFSEPELTIINNISKNIPCVLSPNMSIGVNALFYLAPKLAKMLGDDYNIEIIEAHHNLKKDAPSGTALKLAELLADGLNRDLKECGVYGRSGITGARNKNEIGIHAVRGGDIVGDHTIVFAGPGERIEVTHRAHNREVFVFGAIKAARFIFNAKPGLYNMQDVLGIKKL
ncbi:MAG: 4-hydroxy-tetrahydrodipicolinate reductase [bacterium]|nr:4-hydroxy-tetrahydrodipicolinate reductase [bacterium]